MITAERREIRDIPYATQSENQRVDLYLPTGTPPPCGYAVVIAIHGGAFRWGDRSLELDALDALIAAGFAVASVGYRLSGEERFPAAVDDVREAVRFLRCDARIWSLDPTRFAAWGRSAGGYLAAMLGLIPDRATGFDIHSTRGGSAAVKPWWIGMAHRISCRWMPSFVPLRQATERRCSGTIVPGHRSLNFSADRWNKWHRSPSWPAC